MSTTFLFDMSNLIYSTCISHHTKTGDQIDLDLMRGLFLSRLKDIRSTLKVKSSDELVLIFDSLNYWRREIFPHYKMTRRKTRDDSTMDWTLFFSSYEKVKEEFSKISPWKCIQVDRAEADDVIGVLAIRLCQTKDIVIVSSDKDFLQLQAKGRQIRQWSILGKWLKPNEYDLFEHIVRGDTGDGIPNILSPGDSLVSGKRQKSLFEKDLLDWKRKPRPEDFCRDREMLERFDINRRLIDLSCIPQDVADDIIKTYENTKPAFGKLTSYIVSCGLFRIMPI